MANKKPSLTQYLIRNKDGSASDGMDNVRKKMNKKSHKGRHYGSGIPAGAGGNDSGAAVGLGEDMGMHNGALPNSFTPNVISRVPNSGRNGPVDTKKENRRNAPRKRSFAEFLRHRHQAEEEEDWDDEDMANDIDSLNTDYPEHGEHVRDYDNADMNDEFDMDEDPANAFDSWARNQEQDPEYDQWRDDQEYDPEADMEDDFPYDPYAEDPDAEYPENEEDLDDEFDDLDPESELDFDDEEMMDYEDEDEFEQDDAEKLASMGTFADFYRDDEHASDDEEFGDEFGDDEYADYDDLDDAEAQDYGEEYPEEYPEERKEEEQEMNPGPGGFEPGQGVGPETDALSASGGMNTPKIDRARMLFQQLINRPGMTRGEMIEIFVKELQTTESTAVSYYERLAKEAGMTNQDNDQDSMGAGGYGPGEDDMGIGMGDEEMGPEIDQDEINQQPPNKQGIIRQVDNAHLVYKKQMEDGSFEELWVFNVADKLDDALKTRRAILAGTDIPRGHTRSDDGQQTYTLSTMGNAQLLHITGLPN